MKVSELRDKLMGLNEDWEIQICDINGDNIDLDIWEIKLKKDNIYGGKFVILGYEK